MSKIGILLVLSAILLCGCKTKDESTYTFILKKGHPVTFSQFSHYPNHTVVGTVKSKLLTVKIDDNNVYYVITNVKK